jgi:hypothetical protein
VEPLSSELPPREECPREEDLHVGENETNPQTNHNENKEKVLSYSPFNSFFA